MKHVFLFLLSLTLQLTTSTAQPKQLQVVHTNYVGGDTSGQRLNDAISISDTLAIVVGTTNSYNGDYTPNPRLDTLHSFDILIAGINDQQKIVWSKTFGGDKTDEAEKIIPTKDGGYVIVGYTLSSHSFDFPDTVQGNLPMYQDLFMLKLDASFNLQWTHLYGGIGIDHFVGVAECESGDLVLLGYGKGLGKDIPFNYPATFAGDWFMVRTDSLGNRKWSQTFGGLGNEDNRGELIQIKDKTYLISNSASNSYDCTYQASWTVPKPTISIRMLIIDTAGNVLQSKAYGGSYGTITQGAFKDRHNRILIYGLSNAKDFYVTPDTPLTSPLVSKLWLLCLDTAGEKVWDVLMGDNNMEAEIYKGSDFIETKDGKYFGAWVTYSPHAPWPSYGDWDIWTAMVDSNGAVESNKIFGSSTEDYITSVYQLGNSFYTIGKVGSNVSEGTQTFNTNTQKKAITLLNHNPVAIPTDPQRENSFSLSPNPANSSVLVQWAATVQPQQLEVKDLSGKRVYKQAINTSQNTMLISVKDWVKGNYLVSLITKKGTVTKTLTIN